MYIEASCRKGGTSNIHTLNNYFITIRWENICSVVLNILRQKLATEHPQFSQKPKPQAWQGTGSMEFWSSQSYPEIPWTRKSNMNEKIPWATMAISFTQNKYSEWEEVFK